MISSKLEYKRSQPLMGTFFSLRIRHPQEYRADHLAGVAARVFAEARRLERIFSKFRADSILSRFNLSALNSPILVNPEFSFLIQLAVQLWKDSEGSFNPFFPLRIHLDSCPFLFENIDNNYFITKKTYASLDLSGIAKGFAVDRAIEILQENHELSGSVNAGGDLRFFHTTQRSANLRLGNCSTPLHRMIHSDVDAIATSSPSVSREHSQSSSTYAPSFRIGLSSDHAISVLADSCTIADALTKVGLFGKSDAIHRCADLYNAKIFVFDTKGTLVESFGAA